jgi:plastocyanin
MSISRLPGLDGARLTRRGLLAGLFIASAGALVACSGGGGSSASGGGTATSGNTAAGGGASAGGGAASTSATVQMTDANKFNPDPVTIAKGGTVTWKNTSSSQHSATCDPSLAANKADASLPSGAQPWNSNLLNPGQSWSYTFNTSGTYKYFCIPHESVGMVGTVTVQ